MTCIFTIDCLLHLASIVVIIPWDTFVSLRDANPYTSKNLQNRKMSRLRHHVCCILLLFTFRFYFFNHFYQSLCNNFSSSKNLFTRSGAEVAPLGGRLKLGYQINRPLESMSDVRCFGRKNLRHISKPFRVFDWSNILSICLSHTNCFFFYCKYKLNWWPICNFVFRKIACLQ